MLIDTHCHLYLDDFSNDLDDVMRRAADAGVQRFYLPAIDSSTASLMFELEKKFPSCIAMMGLHPCSVKENYKEELEFVNQWLTQRSFAAVGEIGLDFYWDKTFVHEQYEAFHQQIAFAKKYDLPIVIHTREAMKETIDVVSQYKGSIKGIFHCFGGTVDEAKQIIDLGFYMGIGGVITYKKAGLDAVIKETGIDHIVLETDSPYLTPVPFRGKRNESSYLSYVLQKISEATGISPEAITQKTTENAMKVFPY